MYKNHVLKIRLNTMNIKLAVIMKEANTQDNEFFSPQSLKISDSSILTKQKNKAEKSKRGRPKMPIWDDYSEDEDNGHEYYEANCHYCDKERPVNILSSQQSADITKALLKVFVCCGIPFAIINNPYFHDLLNLLQSSYVLLHNNTLSGPVLNREIARIVIK
ncbi:36065_t:CDS:2 [Racocetra persica]|uniref:36065_t:CDS:1 n=1 Tax=Racocetra persica TaxID=160502 RepID=A0ACA9QBI5_9GLOM|nr:36065_t:CDS:2 [Racocetra persica]